MGTSGFQCEMDQGTAAVAFFHAIMSARRFAARIGFAFDDAGQIAGNRSVNEAGWGIGTAGDQCQILALKSLDAVS